MTDKRLLEMFAIQDNLNKSILDSNYANESIPFYRAALVEAGELLEHRGYKWWKKTDNYDEKQAQMEIVDIWHFLMSTILSESDPYSNLSFITDNFKSKNHKALDKEQQLESIDFFIGCMSSGSLESYVNAFTSMMFAFNLTFDNLYKMYIGKNALNYFRQDNGYKEGTYNKEEWVSENGDFVEDNVVLAEILESDWNTFDDVYNSLKYRYPGD